MLSAGGRAESVRAGLVPAESGREFVRAALGPIAVGVYALSQFLGTSPYGFGGLVWAALVGFGVAAVLIVRRRITTTQVLALQVLAGSLLRDCQFSNSDPLRDLNLYLHAGAQFLAGAPVYTTLAMNHYPYGGYLPFLYAPPAVPVFAVLSELPFWLVGSAWLGLSVAAIVYSLRVFGLSWQWALLALLWPPIEEGLFVGNVAIPVVLLLALAPRYGELLGLGTMFKPQNGIIWLWLVRQRAWRRVAAGVALAAAVVLLTLPLTGIGMWADWIRALAAYQRSQEIEPTFYGIGLGRWLPELVLVPLAAAVVGAALLRRGRKGLARLGLASVVASPSLWIHGFVFAIPEFLRLRGQWFWMAVALCAFGRWPGPQMAIGLVVAGWFVGPRVSSLTERFLPRTTVGPTTHPLGRRAVQVRVADAAKPTAAAGHSAGHAATPVAMGNLPEA
jgi:hypothetical protein